MKNYRYIESRSQGFCEGRSKVSVPFGYKVNMALRSGEKRRTLLACEIGMGL